MAQRGDEVGVTLNEADKARIMALLAADKALPPADRALLFPTASGPELTWAGKPGMVPRPAVRLRLVERVSPAGESLRAPEARSGREAPASQGEQADREALGGATRQPAPHPWRNLLVQGDNHALLAALLKGSLRRAIEAAGGLKLVYIDPPFDAGADFSLRRRIGGDDGQPATALAQAAYRDRWGDGAASYLSMMLVRLRLIHELLADAGSLYVHCDWRVNAALRLLLEETFGRERFVNEIVWHYYNKYSAGARHLPRAHDSILVFSKTGRHTFNPLRVPREAPRRQLVRENVAGVLKNARDAAGRLRYRLVSDKKGDDVWRLPQLQPASSQWSGFQTQKHHALLERIVLMGSDAGDLVADFFCGSGTTLAVAQALGRRWLGCDLSPQAVQLTRKRLIFGMAGASETTHAPRFDVLMVEPDVRVAAGPTPAPEPPPASDLPPLRLTLRTGLHRHALRVSIAGISVTDSPPVPASAPAPGQELLLVRDGGLRRIARTRHGALAEQTLTARWSDWLDAWSVDFGAAGGEPASPAPDARMQPAAVDAPPGEPFRGDWHAARSYKRRALPLRSAVYVYPGPRRYRLRVRAWDVLGREITEALEVEV
ncbi:MAG: site-specific DNA-methyltransferase [Candidatus Lambdaproteobacteria bacterium]|nr:site-specific DNA-methyltransferase [Candidatus Lambdaproteobacteria bacterium]